MKMKHPDFVPGLNCISPERFSGTITKRGFRECFVITHHRIYGERVRLPAFDVSRYIRF